MGLISDELFLELDRDEQQAYMRVLESKGLDDELEKVKELYAIPKVVQMEAHVIARMTGMGEPIVEEA